MRLPVAVLSSLAVSQLAAAQGADVRPRRAQTEEVRTVLDHALPVLDGKRLRVEGVEVTYAPGASSPPHRHPCAAIVYVAAGSIRSRSGSEPEATYGTGQSFYEAPNALHAVSANASSERPARLVAYFVCDTAAPVRAHGAPQHDSKAIKP